MALLILLSMISIAHANNLNHFIISVVEDFKFISPTIIFDEEVPDICRNVKRALCLDKSQNDAALIAKHLETLYLSRKQDGVIFADDGDGMTELVEEITQLIPLLFRTQCPVIVPLGYSHLIDLRLDSNSLFYMQENDYKYKLFDIYAFNGGPPITKELGLWSKAKGMELLASTNRWNRRNDMQGAMLINALKYYKNRAEPIYDSGGNVIGSRGSMQERIYDVAERLNLTIETKLTPDDQFGVLLKNGTWTGCVGMVKRSNAHVCSAGLSWSIIRSTAIDYIDSFTIPRGCYTLIGQSTRKMNLDMWVYVGVFGLRQLMVFVGVLMAILVGVLLASCLIYGTEINAIERASLGLNMLFLFTIQLGNHPKEGPLAIRILSLCAAILTFIMFAYFNTIVTAQMTSLASPDNPINTFDDVLKNKDVQVIVVNGSSWTSHLQKSAKGSAKHMVYKDRIENNGKAWFKSIALALDAVRSNPNTYLYGHTFAAEGEPGVIALRMSDSTPSAGGFGIQKGSELLGILNYQMLKLAETGIIEHIEKIWNDGPPNEEFGMVEPGALGINNVLFPFTLLAIGTVTAVLFGWLEFMMKNVMNLK